MTVTGRIFYICRNLIFAKFILQNSNQQHVFLYETNQILSYSLHHIKFKMKLLFNLILLISSVTGFNRNVRSCSNDLKMAFHSLIRGDQVIVAVPKAE